jgi:hypothetical protein
MKIKTKVNIIKLRKAVDIGVNFKLHSLVGISVLEDINNKILTAGDALSNKDVDAIIYRCGCKNFTISISPE